MNNLNLVIQVRDTILGKVPIDPLRFKANPDRANALSEIAVTLRHKYAREICRAETQPEFYLENMPSRGNDLSDEHLRQGLSHAALLKILTKKLSHTIQPITWK